MCVYGRDGAIWVAIKSGFLGLSTLHSSPFREIPTSGLALSEYYKEHRALLSRADIEYMSMADGRTLNVTGRYEFKPNEPKLIVRVGGSLAQVKSGLGGAVGGGARGVVTGFSSASRRRLMRLIASLERGERPIFVTMTYPDMFPDQLEKWKRDVDVFGKRLARKYERAGFVWRIEFKERQSGGNKGRVAPHFHLLVYGVGYRDLLAWVPGAWWGVVASGNDTHLRVGTRVERIHSWGGVMRYVGKYIAKEDDYPDDWKGRAWGVVGRSNLPWAVEVIIGLTQDESIRLVRLGRKMIGAGRRSFDYGLTWIVNTERVLDYLEFLAGFT